MKNIILFALVFSVLSSQIEFNEGPYGAEYFDIAGPFTLIDMNMEIGDVNFDNAVNIEVAIPIIKVTEKPFIGPLPNENKAKAANKVVKLASTMVEIAF